jgi:hypothetical protein
MVLTRSYNIGIFGPDFEQMKKKLRGEAFWIDLEERIYYGKKKHPKYKSDFVTKSIAGAVRRWVKEALAPPKDPERMYYRPKTFRPRIKRDKVPYQPITIAEMPEELRYLSYPHLRPKPSARKKEEATRRQDLSQKDRRLLSAASLGKLAAIITLFFKDIWNGKPKV